MQMDARRRCACCSWCFACGNFKPHNAYIKNQNNNNNKNLYVIQATLTVIKIANIPTTSQRLTHLPKTKAIYNHNNNVPAVHIIKNLAYRRKQRQVVKESKGSHSKWLTFTTSTNGSCNHKSRINIIQHQLTGIRFVLSVISCIHVGFIVTNLPCVGSCSQATVAVKAIVVATLLSVKILLRTQTHTLGFTSSQSLAPFAAVGAVGAKSHTPPHAFTPLTMGSCFGRCVAKDGYGDDADVGNTATYCLWRKQHATDEQEAELVSNASDICPKENFIYRIMKFKAKQKRAQFIDKFWEKQDLQYTKLTNRNGSEGLSDIQLQNLDVHNLLSNAILAKESALNYCISEAQYAAASSRASSSLDLEWEHEYGHMRQLYQQPHNTHRSTQSLLLTTNNSNNNLAQYANSNITPIHQLHGINNNNNALSNSTTNTLAIYDNHPLQVHLNDSWQYLSNDEDQLNSLASYTQTQSQSLTYAPLNAAATSLAASVRAGDPSDKRMRMRRSPQAPPINERRNSSFTRTFSSHNSWSHISTPESLEWDQDEEQQRQLRVEDDNLDHETLELLHQIEQLKNRVLDETGDGLYNDVQLDSIETGGTSEGIHFVVSGLCSAQNERRNIS